MNTTLQLDDVLYCTEILTLRLSKSDPENPNRMIFDRLLPVLVQGDTYRIGNIDDVHNRITIYDQNNVRAIIRKQDILRYCIKVNVETFRKPS